MNTTYQVFGDPPRPRPKTNGGTAPPDDERPIFSDLRPWWRDPETIPPRPFLFGRHYMRRAVGATIAASGVGKTTLSTFDAVMMAFGRDPMTATPLPGGPLRVCLLNGEEEQDELDRRAAAVCQRYRVSRTDLGGRLFVRSVRDHPLRIAVMKGGTPVIDGAMVRQLIKFVERNRIDAVLADPLISFHGVVENDNAHMDLLIKQGFGAVASATNAAVEVFHHPGKPKPGTETVVEDGRGAYAIICAVRSARVLNFMTADEAARLGMADDERKLYVRIANGKANYSGPLGKAKWMKFEVENLPKGDQVACASPWTPPNPFDNVTVAHVELARQLAQTGAHRADSRSPEWFGYPLAELLGINVGADGRKAHAQLNHIIKTWLKNNVLRIERRKDAGRKDRQYIVPGANGAQLRPAPVADNGHPPSTGAGLAQDRRKPVTPNELEGPSSCASAPVAPVPFLKGLATGAPHEGGPGSKTGKTKSSRRSLHRQGSPP
jgi:hypothetical protein